MQIIVVSFRITNLRSILNNFVKEGIICNPFVFGIVLIKLDQFV